MPTGSRRRWSTTHKNRLERSYFAVLDVELVGSVPEALVEDDTFDVARQRGRRIGVGPDVDTERFGRVRIDELGDLFTQLVDEVRRGHVRIRLRRSGRRRRSHG